jgi:predicted MFS family arabinose efflux permease
MYSLGAILSLPFVVMVSDGLGRRAAILLGSLIMVLGAGLQAGAKSCTLKLERKKD